MTVRAEDLPRGATFGRRNEDGDLLLYRSEGEVEVRTLTHRDTGQTKNALCVHAFPEGGGFETWVPLADVVRPSETADCLGQEKWRLARFGAEWFNGETVEGWVRGEGHNGTHVWNGWAQPRMTKSQVEAWLKVQAKYWPDDDAMQFNWDGDVLLVDYEPQDPDEPAERIEAQRVEGIPEPTYDVSLGLTWYEED